MAAQRVPVSTIAANGFLLSADLYITKPEAPRPSERQEQWDIFLSYASEDRDFVLKVYEELEQRNIRVWLDKRVLVPVDNLRQAIEHGVGASKRSVVVLSKYLFEKDLD